MNLKALQQYVRRLEEQLNTIYTNPDEVIGKLAAGYNQMLGANQRLSALCASMLKNQGGKATLTKELLESFKGFSINIKWELPEGTEKPEEATRYVFSYDAIPMPQQQAQAPEGAPPAPDTPEAPPSAPEAATTPPPAARPEQPPAPACPVGIPQGPAGYIPSQGEAVTETPPV